VYDSGILSVNHRSQEFVALSTSCIGLLKDKLQIPEDYTVFFNSSATECWEIIAQSLVINNSYHLYNGAFGEKWADHTEAIRGKNNCHRQAFELNEVLHVPNLHSLHNADLIALTHTETSNATCLPAGFIENLRLKYAQAIIAIDATSAMGGVQLPFPSADIWFASVQKCFGLPAGLAIMVCSPRVRERCAPLTKRYNDLSAMFDRMDAWQTTYTPNVLGIALLAKVLAGRNWDDTALKNRAKDLYEFVIQNPQLGTLLVSEPHVRSQTVIAVQASETLIANLKTQAKQAGFLLGNGYGKWAKDTYRIANFPAINDLDLEELKGWMKNIF
jgi:phosphoserine aminotransferase